MVTYWISSREGGVMENVSFDPGTHVNISVSFTFFMPLNFVMTSFAGSRSRFFTSFHISSPQQTGMCSCITLVDPLLVPVPCKKDFEHFRQVNSRYVIHILFLLSFLMTFGHSLKKAYITERQTFFLRFSA